MLITMTLACIEAKKKGIVLIFTLGLIANNAWGDNSVI